MFQVTTGVSRVARPLTHQFIVVDVRMGYMPVLKENMLHTMISGDEKVKFVLLNLLNEKVSRIIVVGRPPFLL